MDSSSYYIPTRIATAQTSQNDAKFHHCVIHRQGQSGKDLLSHQTRRHPHEQSCHRADTAKHHQFTALPPQKRHQHSNKQRITWPPRKVTRQRWLQKRQQQQDMGCAYRSWQITSSTNGLYLGRINKNSIRKINQTHKYYTPTTARCTTTQEEENEVQEIISITYGGTYLIMTNIEESFVSYHNNIITRFRLVNLHPNELWNCPPKTTTYLFQPKKFTFFTRALIWVHFKTVH